MVSDDVIHSLSDATGKIAIQVANQIERTERQIAVMQSSLSELRKAHKSLVSASGAKSAHLIEAEDSAPRTTAQPKTVSYERRVPSRAARAREIIAKSLIDAQKPLNRAELLDCLVEAGVEMNGKKPAVKVSKILWNARDKFTNVGPGYWFVGKPIPTEPDKPS